MMRAFLLGTILVAAALSATGQELWQGAQFGMTPEQVRNVHPKAEDAASKASAAGVQTLLRDPHVEIADRSFEVAYNFRDGKLSSVTLSINGGEQFNAMHRLYETLRTALTAKYGKENSRATNDRGFIKSAQTNWVAGQVAIALTMAGAGDSPAFLVIVYDGSPGKAAGKL